MTHLSSCYFCGVALDKPLQTCELPSPEPTDTTVTLCSSCMEKLNVVLDATGDADLVAVSDQRPTADTRDDASSGPPESGTKPEQESTQTTTPGGESTETSETGQSMETTATDEDPEDDATVDTPATGGEDTRKDETQADGDVDTADSVAETASPVDEGAQSQDADGSPDPDEGGLDDKADGDASTDREESDTVVADDPLSEEEDPFSEDAFDDDVGVDIENGADEEFFAADDTLGSEDSEGENIEVSEFGDDIDDPTAQEEETDASEGQSAGEPSAGDSESDSTQSVGGGEEDDTSGLSEDGESGETDDGDTAEESGDGTDPAKTTISALEYNKVMRMLQNRDFPINREEIEIVAANAYDLARSECAKVIDLAVDRGLLDERDGQLYRPEE